ncbi:sulfite exporter TauE/SafE family protein [Amylibacter sp. SFDW26]|uniref:sulfite exporter TauE/SafE family protein n=1 Tax=Amylibacter sp. SFDW26 TaxID=2652722 RepID=UPI0012620191|nr:sulfite exporter TauE/SafE family protein [Amylibacter sp. SFDW26]KAB7615318.1 sulfite exporter TauE/SafE family protein [Amylibacter sp. SFDW26]
METTILIAVAAFLAGILNAIAGGGSFLTFPALVFAGVPPVIANATSAIAVFPGYLAAAIGFKEDISSVERKQLIRQTGITLVGGLIGALLLLVSSNDFFTAIVPFLLLASTAIFAFQDRILAWGRSGGLQLTPYGAIGTLVVAIYGGYFNGGLGIVLLALYAMWGLTNLNVMNGLKNGVSFVISAISVLTFAIAGLIVWPSAIIMMIANILGGYFGAKLAKRLSKTIVRNIVIAVGLVMSAVFFYRLFI